jgi:Tfp pilus assembly protein PilV
LPGIPDPGRSAPMRAGIALIELLIALVVAAMSVAAVFGYLTR